MTPADAAAARVRGDVDAAFTALRDATYGLEGVSTGSQSPVFWSHLDNSFHALLTATQDLADTLADRTPHPVASAVWAGIASQLAELAGDASDTGVAA
jgi:hypothetical protein